MLVLARSPATYRSRVQVSVVLLLLGVGFALLYQYAGIAIVRQVVHGLSFVVLMISAFGGVAATVDLIAREKRDGTLGLLLLTHLSPAEIALGKFASGGLTLLYGLLIALPLFSLFVIAGGIAWTEVLSIAAVATNILFASAAIGLFVSTFSLDRKKANGRAVWIVMSFWWLLPMAADLADKFGGPPFLSAFLRAISFSGGFGRGPAMFGFNFNWLNLIAVHLVGWAFLGGAIYLLPRKWQEHPAKSRFKLREWWRQLSYGRGEARRNLRTELLNRSAFFWLAARDRSRRWHGWFTVAFVFILLVALTHRAEWFQRIMFGALAASVVLQLVWTSVATYQMELEREQGTVEMLLSTPLTPHDIMHGQWLALIRYYAAQIAVLFGVQVLLAGYIMAQKLWSDSAHAGLALLLVSLVFLFNFYALHHSAMWSAVTVKQQKQAAATALAQCLFIPALLTGFIFATVGLLNWLGFTALDPSPGNVFSTWFGLQCGINSFWIALAKRRLPEKMREWAMRRYQTPEAKPTAWETLRRLLHPRSTRPAPAP